MSENIELFKTIFLNNAELEYIESYLCNFNSNKDKLRKIDAILPEEHILEIKNNFKNLLELPIDTFEVEKELNDVVYQFDDKDQLKYYSAICNSLNICPNNSNYNSNSEEMLKLEEMPSPTNLKFIIHKMRYVKEQNEQCIYIISKQDRIALNKKKNIFMRTEEDFCEMDNSKFYIFNSYITCIFVEDKVFVVDYKNFINLFNYKEFLQTRVNQVIDNFQSEGIISNFEEYKDSLNHYRNFNSLTKVSEDPESIRNFLQKNSNIEKIEKIQNQYECFFKFDKETHKFEISGELGLKIMIRIISNRTGFDFEDNPFTFASKYSLKPIETSVPTP
ncbi:Kiwa anti-phage protein KwaB-like domain-containing protein [Rummeliibacillus sp. NPDC094406]|uniref:Kiwa anti-phage protein KwaB-like domain-containing protein n=1 Tax=Rummeliibacillus sp. NPDC094406 TaxID=3364511 RepID=UPI0037F7A488